MAHAATLRRALVAVACVGLVAAAGLVPAAAAPAAPAKPPAPITAAAWRLVPERSALTFRAVQAGAEFEGRFARYTTDIAFDPAALTGSRFDVRIDAASAETLEAQRDETLRGPDFFAAAQFPQAHFIATQFNRSTTGYAAIGTLTLRGVTRPLTVRFQWTAGPAGSATLTGDALVRRLDFGVGQGEWQSTEWVGNDVKIAFRLQLQRQHPQ